MECKRSNQLLANQFPIVDPKDLQKLPFQPALLYQQESLGELAVGKFMHDIECNMHEEDDDDNEQFLTNEEQDRQSELGND